MFPDPSNANNYVQKLSELLLHTQATVRNGSGLSETSLDEGSKKAVQWILSAKAASAKVMLIGNGGSAAIVSHIQNDLCDSVGVRAIVFNEPPFLTAVSNDHGYETFFEQAIKLWTDEADLLIAVSSSGRSESILRAVQAGRDKGTQIITFSGFLPNNPLRQLGDLNFYISSQAYGFVETAHAVLGHFLTDSAIASQQAVKAR